MDEHKETLKLIAELKEILGSERALRRVIIKELKEVREQYGDDRRTQIVDEEAEITLEDLIREEDVVITVSHSGYVKRTPLSSYRSQGRGGKGRIGATTRSEDFIEHLFVASTHSYLLIFTNRGRIYWLKAYDVPEVGTSGKGRPIVNLVNLEPGETIADILSVRDFAEGRFVLMATRKGIVKKTSLSAFSNPRSSGIIAITVDEDDELIDVALTDGSHEVLLATRNGLALRFREDEVRDMGRTARGVRGIALREGDYLVGMETFKEKGMLLAVTERGFGKRTSIGEYRLQGRGGKGVINVKTTERNGKVVNALHVTEDDSVMIITAHGKLIKLEASAIRQTVSRSAQGVRLIGLEAGDHVTSAAVIRGTEE